VINAPSVRQGEEILRVAPSATHTEVEVEKFVEGLETVWRELDIPCARN
jgi:5-aminolevulinate synthase